MFTRKEKVLKTKNKILFVYPLFSSFVKTDFEILSENYNVIRHQYKHKKSVVFHLLSQIKILFWLIKNIITANAVYIWFADYHSFLPVLFAKLFNKKSFLVLGGYDVTYIPEYNYGSFNNPLRASLSRYSIKNANLCFAVSDNIKDDAEYLAPGSRVKIIYTGYSDKTFTDLGLERKGVLSVIGAETRQRLYIKGVDLIVDIAKILTDLSFTLVAVNKELFENEFGVVPNINTVEHLEQSELIKLYQKAEIYLQTSMREGLPNSVCEAMLCGTIPVGVNAGGIPIAIGECGFVSKNRDASEVSELIKKALKKNSELQNCGKQRIKENFSLELRKEKILSTIKKTI